MIREDKRREEGGVSIQKHTHTHKCYTEGLKFQAFDLRKKSPRKTKGSENLNLPKQKKLN